MSVAALPILLAEATHTGPLRWHAMPAAWMFWMVVVPLAVLVGWWSYQRDRDVPRHAKAILATLRSAALVFLLLVLFGPYRETSETREVRGHVLILVDTSSSMSTVDGYEPEDARALASAAGVPVGDLGKLTRIDLAQKVLANRSHALLEGLTEKFRVHVYGFGSQLVPLVSTGDSVEEETAANAVPPADRIRARLPELRAADASTRIGQAVSFALDAYRLRDEDVAGVVVISDGQQNGGTVSPVAAGRKASAQGIPIYAVGVGDPRSPKNIHVSNLRAKEVVLAKDTAVFEFDVHAKGFADKNVDVEMQALDESGNPRGSPYVVNPSGILLEGGENAQPVRVTYRFENAGTYALRIGIPVEDEEKIKSDNFVLHTMRVIDRKVKVLYVEETPRWEFQYLSNALCRDRDTMLTHTLLLTADPESPQRKTNAPAEEWPALETRYLPVREKIFEYDVIVLGDVDPRSLGESPQDAQQAIENLRDFVERGGGLIAIAGARNNPSKYRDTYIAGLLPVVVDRTAEREAAMRATDSTRGFAFRITKDGEDSPMMNVAGDPARSKQLWETEPTWRQYWSYPALRAKTLAKVLAESNDVADENRFGPRPVIATMPYGRGRTLFLGVDELWRVRHDVGDRYFYRFFGEAVRYLATYKLLGGNKRFKIMTDLDTYTLDDSVHITVDVLDRDYEPSRAPSQTVKLEMPGTEPGKRETVDLVLAPDASEKGTYKKTIVPTRAGDYRLTAATDDPKDEIPEKIFHVVQSSLEGRDLLLNEAALRDMAAASAGGDYRYLADLPSLAPAAKKKEVPTNVHEDDLWDNGWTLVVAVSLLGAEWLLRKRWRLV